MALRIKRITWTYRDRLGALLTVAQSSLVQGGHPVCRIVFEDEREAELDVEQRLLAYDIPGVYLGDDFVDDEIFTYKHPDDGVKMTMRGATDDAWVVKVAQTFLAACVGNTFRPADNIPLPY